MFGQARPAISDRVPFSFWAELTQQDAAARSAQSQRSECLGEQPQYRAADRHRSSADDALQAKSDVDAVSGCIFHGISPTWRSGGAYDRVGRLRLSRGAVKIYGVARSLPPEPQCKRFVVQPPCCPIEDLDGRILICDQVCVTKPIWPATLCSRTRTQTEASNSILYYARSSENRGVYQDARLDLAPFIPDRAFGGCRASEASRAPIRSARNTPQRAGSLRPRRRSSRCPGSTARMRASGTA